MSFMDNVSAFTKGVGQKAKGNYDILTLNNQITNLNKDMVSYILDVYLKTSKK